MENWSLTSGSPFLIIYIYIYIYYMNMKKRLDKSMRFKRSRAGNVIRRNVFKISVWTHSFHGEYWMKSIKKRHYLAKYRN